MELQDAINQAMAFARQALPGQLSVEEVEYQDSPPAWRVTVGYKRALPEKRRAVPLGLAAPATTMYERMNQQHFVEYEDVYKTVIVPENGGKLSMKIRKI